MNSQQNREYMKKTDLLLLGFILILLSPFLLSHNFLSYYLDFNRDHGMITSFIKFGILATLGEIIGQRIRTAHYNLKGFGLLPKIIIWGFIGLTIKISFVIFVTGTPVLLTQLGFENALQAMHTGFSINKLMVAFCISIALNTIYAPVMMTFHKITDIHIHKYNGQLISLMIPIDFLAAFKQIDWKVQWTFVFKKTIPLFWIPAHTLTFLLPGEFQVLFAAVLSIVLGLILALATLKSEK